MGPRSTKKRERLTEWAFARYSLKLTDEQFESYTPAQIAALTEAHNDERRWNYAVAISCALNTKWGDPDKPIKFLPKDFLPKTPEEQEKYEKQAAKLQALRQKMFAGQLNAMVRSLQEKNDGQK